ncbi:MAG TPA: STAS domain-containing protein [Candidatus Baltobacteraceae bacterium]|nr:STAS domain-containing protein [Candidatus Baltobacteraceae bacterium]
MHRERAKILKYEEPLGISRAELHERFVKSYEEPVLIIDLHGIDLLDSTFLSELVQLRTHRNEHGLESGRLVIDSPYVRTALNAVGLEYNWSVYESLDEALASVD